MTRVISPTPPCRCFFARLSRWEACSRSCKTYPTFSQNITRLSWTPSADTPWNRYKNVVEVSVVLPNYFNAYGRKEPTGPNHLPSSFLEGQPELQYSQVLNQDPARRQVFMHAMSLNHRRVPTTGMYDISWVIEKARQDPNRCIWVDVGGGTGYTVKVFREVYPELPAAQCVVQDLPEVIEEAKSINDPDLREVTFIGFDFHKESPVPGKPFSFSPLCVRTLSYHDIPSARYKGRRRYVIYGNNTLTCIVPRWTGLLSPPRTA